MAKVTKSAVAPAAAPAPAPAGETTAPVAKKVFGKEPNGADVFKRVLGEDGKGAPITHTNAKGEVVPMNTPQVKVIANLLEAHPEGMTRKELCEKLPAAGLVTKQPVGRIVSYYQKPGVDNGIWTITKASTAPAAA